MIDETLLIDIYNRHKNELYIYIYRLTGSRESAEDLLHDCFVNLITYSQKNHIEEKTVRAFLYRASHNLSINYMKKQSRVIDIEDETITNRAAFENPSEAIEMDELQKKIAALLWEVDEETRSMFIMRKELNMPLDEIARNTGRSERTVRRKLTKTVNYLAENLKKEGFLSNWTVFLSILSLLFVVYNRKITES